MPAKPRSLLSDMPESFPWNQWVAFSPAGASSPAQPWSRSRGASWLYATRAQCVCQQSLFHKDDLRNKIRGNLYPMNMHNVNAESHSDELAFPLYIFSSRQENHFLLRLSA